MRSLRSAICAPGSCTQCSIFQLPRVASLLFLCHQRSGCRSWGGWGNAIFERSITLHALISFGPDGSTVQGRGGVRGCPRHTRWRGAHSTTRTSYGARGRGRDACRRLNPPRTRTRDASQQHPRPIKGVGPAEEGETQPRLLLLLRRHLSLHPSEAKAVVQTDAGEHALRDGGLGVVWLVGGDMTWRWGWGWR
jgi:hypothetical protein